MPESKGASPFEGDFFDLVRAMVAKKIWDRAGKIDRVNLERTVKACGALWAAPGRPDDVTALKVSHFVHAEMVVQSKYGYGTASQIASTLEWIAKTLDKQGICVTPLRWKKSRDTRADSAGRRSKVGAQFEKERASKLPAEGVIDALATLSNRKDLSDADRILSCATNLLVTCGFRASEVLTLPRNTVVLEPVKNDDGTPVFGPDGKPDMDVCLRYWPAKGGHVALQMKPVPPPYRSIVLRAVQQVTELTAPHAELAKFMRENPGRTQFGEPWDSMPDDALLRYDELANMLGFGAPEGAGEQTQYGMAGNFFIKHNNLMRSVATMTASNGRLYKATVVRKGDVAKVLESRRIEVLEPYASLPDGATLEMAQVAEMLGLKSQDRVKAAKRFVDAHDVAILKEDRVDSIGRLRRNTSVVLKDDVIAAVDRANLSVTRLADPWGAMSEDTLMTAADVGRAIGAKITVGGGGPALSEKGREWCETVGIARHDGEASVKCRGAMVLRAVKMVKKADVMAAVAELSSHNENLLPDRVGELRLDDALFVVPVGFFSTIRNDRINGSVSPVRYPVLQIWLRGRADQMQKSVFERFEFRDSEGKPFSVKTHAFRHFLDTLLSAGGIGEMERARFAGRVKIDQNSAYEHVPGHVRAKRVLEMINAGKAISPAVEHAKRMPDPVRREEFQQAMYGQAGHLTELGLCSHDFAATPCPNHGSHSDCKDHWICKGDPRHRAETERQLENNRWLLDLVRKEQEEGTYGADEWADHTARVCDRLEKILSVHRSNMIPDGWLVQLNADGEVIDFLEWEATSAAE